MGCLKLSYYPTNFEVTKNYFKKELTSNFSEKNVRSSYELTNHLGNVKVTVSDRKLPVDDGTYSGGVKINSTPDGIIDFFEPDVLSAVDHYPGGFPMPNRSFNANSYRYGYNKGSEKDDEITGVVGSHFTTYFREFDTRILIPWSPDPVFQPWQSPYSYMDGNPILYNDPLGDRVKIRDRQTRKSVRAARKEDAAFNQQFKDWRKEKGHTYVFEQARGENNGLFAAVRDVQQNGKHSKNSTVVQFDLINGNTSKFVGTQDGGISKINPLETPNINMPTPDMNINTQQRDGVPPLPTPAPINVTMNAPFVPDQPAFVNPNQANVTIGRAAQTFLNNSNATQISIRINTILPQSQQNAVLPTGQTLGQLLQQRGNMIQQNLINQGVPANAFGPNSIQINFGQPAINTNINIR